ncbi:MAG: undecaprenyldiphospho-muramoylpentapeptide beta-N-acetylglucosaminyltransferase [Fidelibacterota bacterium]
MQDKIKVIIAGGGTGGHLFPAMAIGDELRARGVDVKFIGSKYGLEAITLPEKGETPLLLNIRGIQRSLSYSSIQKNLLFPFLFFKAFLDSHRFIKKFKPHVVVGTGGYSSGLPLLAAIRMGLPTLIQEQNSYPGITTRKLSRKVNVICTAFEESSKYLSGDIRLFGNPVRHDLKVTDSKTARHVLGIGESLPTIFILGGSQGSLPLNLHFQRNHEKYIAEGFQIIWQCGESHYSKIEKLNKKKNVHIFPFIQNMGQVYSASDLVICRAGALTLAELSVCRKASILIPFPFAAADHQTINALSFEKNGAAILLPQSDLESGALEEQVFDLFKNRNMISQMEENAGSLAHSEATSQIADTIIGLA